MREGGREGGGGTRRERREREERDRRTSAHTPTQDRSKHPQPSVAAIEQHASGENSREKQRVWGGEAVGSRLWLILGANIEPR